MPVAPGAEGTLGHNKAFRRESPGHAPPHLAAEDDPVMRLRLPFPGIRAVAITAPELVQEVLVENAKHFDKSDMLRFSLWKLAGEGLFTSNGELWRRQRRIMAPLFTPRALDPYAGDMIACARRTVDAWPDGRAPPARPRRRRA